MNLFFILVRSIGLIYSTFRLRHAMLLVYVNEVFWSLGIIQNDFNITIINEKVILLKIINKRIFNSYLKIVKLMDRKFVCFMIMVIFHVG